ncbi:MAG: TrkA family potassium uptake protein [Dehalococcoidia bacterium]
MFIVIVGGGKVGYYLSRELIEGGHEVLVIDKDVARVQQLTDELGQDVAVRGDGCEVATLMQAGMDRADMVLAVTGDDEDNLVVCQVANRRFNVPRTVARINNPKNEDIFRKLGIATTVSATSAILAQIEQELPSHALIPLMKLRGGGFEIVEVKIPAGAAVVGQRLRDIMLPQQSLISLIIDTEGVPRVPNSDSVIEAEDEVIAVTKMESEGQLRAVLTNAPASRGA